MLNVTYIKSNKARKEFEEGNRTLSLKHRQLLIMVDGKRSCHDLVSVFGSSSIYQMLVDLEKLGFLINQEDKAAAKNLNNTKANSVETNFSQHHLAFIKTFLTDEAQLQLGLMGREIERKIATVSNAEDLKSCIPLWHMAIRDSRNGRTVADTLMERLAHLMANPPQLSASQLAS